MRIVFIGGTGFIGHHAAVEAIDAGHEVVCIHRGVSRNEVKGARSIVADRADPDALAAALRAAAGDVVVDTRCMTRTDAETVRGLVDVPIVVLSSQDVYAQFGRLNGLPAPAPEAIVTEGSPLTIPYPFRGIFEHSGGPDYDKKNVEAVFADRDAIILRLPAVYGPRDRARRFGWIVDAIDAGQTTFVDRGGADWRWTCVHVRDAAFAIRLAGEAAPAGQRIFNVGEQDPPTIREWVDAIASHMTCAIGWEAGEPVGDGWLDPRPNDFVSSSDRIREALGWHERTTHTERIADIVARARETRPA